MKVTLSKEEAEFIAAKVGITEEQAQRIIQMHFDACTPKEIGATLHIGAPRIERAVTALWIYDGSRR